MVVTPSHPPWRCAQPQKALRAESNGIKTTGGKPKDILIWNSSVKWINIDRKFQHVATMWPIIRRYNYPSHRGARELKPRTFFGCAKNAPAPAHDCAHPPPRGSRRAVRVWRPGMAGARIHACICCPAADAPAAFSMHVSVHRGSAFAGERESARARAQESGSAVESESGRGWKSERERGLRERENESGREGEKERKRERERERRKREREKEREREREDLNCAYTFPNETPISL